MTINLNTDELTSLVRDHINGMGLKGQYNITFTRKNATTIDTSIEILPATAQDSNEQEKQDDSESSEAEESYIDKLTK